MRIIFLLETNIAYVRFEVSTAVTMQNAAATCSRWFSARGFFYPEDGGDTSLRNVCLHNIYTAPHPRRQHSSELILVYMYFV
jgi:hypothetical protein